MEKDVEGNDTQRRELEEKTEGGKRRRGEGE